ncbi:MAG TPA: divalent-cation tolerance protein CutA [Candidatus Nanoarchaeia archaeon]|nr:divalent-cation tolerance protein CutA [Candidatus Nanoarchaeia archaeon]
MMMVYVTCKNFSEAGKISKRLLEKRLIACANIFPVKSLYAWKGKIVQENEHVIIMKTLRQKFSKIKAEILKMHSYDVPCIVGYEMKAGHADYLKWLRKTVKDLT